MPSQLLLLPLSPATSPLPPSPSRQLTMQVLMPVRTQQLFPLPSQTGVASDDRGTHFERLMSGNNGDVSEDMDETITDYYDGAK